MLYTFCLGSSSLFVTSRVRALPSPSLLVFALLAWVTAFLKGPFLLLFFFLFCFCVWLASFVCRSSFLTLVFWVLFLLLVWPGGFLNALCAMYAGARLALVRVVQL